MQAKGKAWLDLLPADSKDIIFTDFSNDSLSAIFRELSSNFDKRETIVQTHFLEPSWLSAIRRYFRNIMCYHHMTVPKLDTLRKHIRRVINNFHYRKCVIIGVSKAVTADLHAYYPFNKCKCVTNAISFESMETLSQLYNPELPLNKEHFNILIHGTDFYRKGVDIAIKAVNAINRDSAQKCRLFITSHNTAECRRYTADCAESTELIEVMDVVDGIKNIYDQIDCFISPSREEAFGYAVVESAYCGCQVIASNVPGQDTLTDIPGIIWTEPENADSLSSAILTAMTNKGSGQLTAVKEAQKKYVQEKYSIQQWISANKAIITEHFS